MLVHAATSPLLRQRAITPRVRRPEHCLEALAPRVAPERARRGGAPRGALRPESVAQQFETLLLPHLSVVTGHLLPRICLLLSSGARDLRMWAVSMLRQILPATTKSLTLRDGALSAIVRERLLPLCPTLLGDHDPIPHYTVNLLVELEAADPARVGSLMRAERELVGALGTSETATALKARIGT